MGKKKTNKSTEDISLCFPLTFLGHQRRDVRKRKLAHKFGLLGIEMYAHLRNFIAHSFALNGTDQSGIVSDCQAT